MAEAPKHIRRWFRYSSGKMLGLVVITAVVAASCIYAYSARHHGKNLQAICEKVARWTLEQPLPVGAHHQFQVSPPLVIPQGSEVNLVKTAGGDVVVLLKTKIGWKGNYEGVLYSTSPLGAGQIGTDNYGHNEVHVPGIDANPPVIRSRVNPKFFRVYFDLG